MHGRTTLRAWRYAGLFAALCLSGVGCYTAPVMPGSFVDAPRELAKVTLPAYVIEPPDVLQIDVAKWEVNPNTKQILKEQSPQPLKPQIISGAHQLKPDGTVHLGVYGSVQLAGLTLDEARDAVKGFLGYWFGYSPEAFAVSVDVLSMNSKVVYVITDGGGYGEQVIRLPINGSDTVLDAIGNVSGLPPVASKNHIWVARRGPYGGPEGCPEQILPVDWHSITKLGDTRTNYQIMPGDRVYVMAKPIIRTSSFLQQVLAPVEQVLGITFLGRETVRAFER
jgi:polysaccharide export outer membrane protein